MVLTIILTLLGLLVLAAVGGGIFLLMAYGLGWAINHLMGFDSFQATILALAAIFVFFMFFERILRALDLLSNNRHSPIDYDDEEDDEDYEDEEDDENYEIVEDEDMLDKLYAGIPRWRRPVKNLDFSNVKPDERCPCGSGRKYKNCHGIKQKKI